MTAETPSLKSRFQPFPFEQWVSNRQLHTLTIRFFNEGGFAGTPRRPDGTLDPAQEANGFVGVYAPDAATAQAWRDKDAARIRNPKPV